MNQPSIVLATLIHYNVAIRDTLEYCLKKDSYDVNLFNEKKRSVIVEVDQHTPLKDIIDHSGENGKNLEKMIRDFYDEVYGDDSTILKLANDGLRVDHAQHLTIYKHVLPIHEQVNAIIQGVIRDAVQRQIDVSEMQKLWKADERMYRGVAMMTLTNDLISLFDDFNKAMKDNKGVPSPATNFISQDIQTVINNINMVKANGRVTELDYKEGVEDRVTALMENITGRRDLRPGQQFPDAMKGTQNAITEYVRVVESVFRDAYVPAMQQLVQEAQNQERQKAEAPTSPAPEAPKAQPTPAKKGDEEGDDVPVDFSSLNTKA